MEYVKQIGLGVFTIMLAAGVIAGGRKLPFASGLFDFIHSGFDS